VILFAKILQVIMEFPKYKDRKIFNAGEGRIIRTLFLPFSTQCPENKRALYLARKTSKQLWRLGPQIS